jgi:CheY-like chemotaxis protein
VKKIQILLVEDEAILQLDLVARLADLGYTEVAVASSGEMAIRKATEIQPDLLLMDIRIKGVMDGIEAASIIRSQLEVPVVFISALNDASTIVRINEFGAAGYLTKPLQDGEIAQAVQSALLQPGATGEDTK